MPGYYPVIDLFAGPGGLGEGFSAFTLNKNYSPFKIVLSIEKEPFAHRTLLLRSFYRKFNPDTIPNQYWSYLKGEISLETLFNLYPMQASKAKEEALCLELGKAACNEVKTLIHQRLKNMNKWVLVGGPPCQAYSLVGRARMKGTNPDFEKDERHFLYIEYLKILADHMPPVFIMENVKGLLSATHSGNKIFDKILNDLRNPSLAIKKIKGLGYSLYSFVDKKTPASLTSSDFVVEAEKFGIPQTRHRILILGVRNDFDFCPEILKRKPAPTISQVIDDLPRIRSSVSKEEDSFEIWKAILSSFTKEKWYFKEPDKWIEEIKDNINLALSVLENEILTSGKEVMTYKSNPAINSSWYRYGCAKIITNHTARSHMRDDLHRYLFASAFALAKNKSPQLSDFPTNLLPLHKNVWEGVSNECFGDRFRVQIKTKPSTTITSHISKDGHYFIHYDPSQCRSLTVREAARLQTFPDSYHFEGSRTAQYRQVGNAVPPMLSLQIAEIVHDILEHIRM